MEYKTDALLLRTVDYGENDRMVTLLTAERGKLGASMKGVRRAAAKLRFAAQPFCFAEYVLAERNGRNTVISASLYDGFFPLRENVQAFYAASAVCEACDKLLYEGMEGGGLLLSAVEALKGMCEGEVSFALIRFLLGALQLAGYPVHADVCPVCGKLPRPSECAEGDGRGIEREELRKVRFDMESGSFVCDSCGKGTPASETTLLTIRAALGGQRREEGEKRALRLLYSYFAYQTDAELSSLAEYIRLL